MTVRPTPNELFKKIRAVKDAVKDNRIALLHQTAMACDAIELDYVIDGELVSLLPECLDVLTPGHYAGQSPPQRSYEPEIAGLELFAFRVALPRLDADIYLKFCYADEMFWLVSFHRDRAGSEAA